MLNKNNQYHRDDVYGILTIGCELEAGLIEKEKAIDLALARINNLIKPDVIGRSELLFAFGWISLIGEQFFDSSKTVDELVDAYLKSKQ